MLDDRCSLLNTGSTAAGGGRVPALLLRFALSRALRARKSATQLKKPRAQSSSSALSPEPRPLETDGGSWLPFPVCQQHPRAPQSEGSESPPQLLEKKMWRPRSWPPPVAGAGLRRGLPGPRADTCTAVATAVGAANGPGRWRLKSRAQLRAPAARASDGSCPPSVVRRQSAHTPQYSAELEDSGSLPQPLPRRQLESPLGWRD